MRGATCHHLQRQAVASHFNSHTPCGVRRRRLVAYGGIMNFNSHTPCGVRLNDCLIISFYAIISTHTPHAGCDCKPFQSILSFNISTHTPHAGCDPSALSADNSSGKFQLTHPMRGATPVKNRRESVNNISTHTPHAGCDIKHICYKLRSIVISTHTPHAGCDQSIDSDGAV